MVEKGSLLLPQRSGAPEQSTASAPARDRRADGPLVPLRRSHRRTPPPPKELSCIDYDTGLYEDIIQGGIHAEVN